jgi:GT2 family glycosyltransferase
MAIKYSLLMLTHNRLGALIPCIRSLHETLLAPDVELIILDNGSSAHTVEWLQGLEGPRVRKMFSRTNLGVAEGRARLIEQACGSVLVFLDSDVVVEDGTWLETLGKALEPENVGVAGPAGSLIRWKGPHLFVPAAVGQCDVVSGWCLAFKREVLAAGVKMRTEEFPMFWSEDSAFCLDVFAAGWDVVNTGYIGVEHVPGLSGDKPGAREASEAKLRELYAGRGLVREEGAWWA